MIRWWEQRTVRDEAGSESGGAPPVTAPAPAAAPDLAESNQPDVSDEEFSKLADFDETQMEEPAAPLPTPKPVEPKVPQPPVQTPTPEPQPVAAQQPAAPQPAVVQPTQPTWPAQPTAEQISAMRTHALRTIEATYVFSEEEKNQLQVEPEKVLPALAAKLHLNIFDTIYTAMVQNLPSLIDARMATYSNQSKSEETFFQRWPALKDMKHKDEVVRIGEIYNRMYPNSDPGKWIEEVGMIASTRLGLPLAAPSATAPAPPPPAPPQHKPFAPANPGGMAAGTPPAPAHGGNEWLEMIQEWDAVERRT